MSTFQHVPQRLDMAASSSVEWDGVTGVSGLIRSGCGRTFTSTHDLADRLIRMNRPRHVGIAALVSVMPWVGLSLSPPADAVPAPEVEYSYNVIVRRHFDFPENDALGYGWAICDKVARGVPYEGVMADTKRDVHPNDEQSANYVVSYAVGILCPAQIWQLRNSAAGYQPPS